MVVMKNSLIYLLSVFITIPFLATGIIYWIGRKLTPYPLKSFHRAADLSLPVYIMAVFILLNKLFQQTFLGYIIIIHLLILASIIIFQWKKTSQIELRLSLKLLWRMMFIIFMAGYLFLVLFGIFQRIL